MLNLQNSPSREDFGWHDLGNFMLTPVYPSGQELSVLNIDSVVLSISLA